MGEDAAEEGSRRAIDAGMEILGGLAGLTVGGLVAGPPGAVGGAIAGPAIAGGLKEVARRALGRREEARVGAAFGSAMLAVREHLDAGREVRTDGFFEPVLGRRPRAEEIVEGALVAAQREHEELKVIHYGYLLANVAFDSGIDLHTANWCLRTAQNLTWTQLVLLRIVSEGDLISTLPGVIGQNEPNWGAWTIHEQLADRGFGRRGLIYAPAEETPIHKIRYPNSDINQQQLSPGGLLLHGLMWLGRIPASEVEAVRVELVAEVGTA
jgi:hypothetical protein